MRDKSHRSLLRPAQKIIEYENAEKRIRRYVETHLLLFLRRNADSVQSIEIEFHCRSPGLHDHLLKNPGGLVRVVRTFLLLRNGIGGSRVGRAEKKKEWENECSESFFNMVLNVTGFLDYALERVAICLMGAPVK